MIEHQTEIRVYYADTDLNGIVHHANYLKFLEQARTEGLRKLGFEFKEIIAQGVQFAINQVSLNYYKPAVVDDLLRITTKVTKIGKASLSYHQEVFQKPANYLVCKANLRVAFVDSAMKAIPVPASIKRSITSDHPNFIN